MNRFEEKWISHMNEAKGLEHLHRIYDTVCLKKCKAFRDCSRCAIEQHYQFLKEGFLVMKEIELHIKTRGAGNEHARSLAADIR